MRCLSGGLVSRINWGINRGCQLLHLWIKRKFVSKNFERFWKVSGRLWERLWEILAITILFYKYFDENMWNNLKRLWKRFWITLGHKPRLLAGAPPDKETQNCILVLRRGFERNRQLYSCFEKKTFKNFLVFSVVMDFSDSVLVLSELFQRSSSKDWRSARNLRY